ncbi:carbonate dehydratase [Roseivirga sp. BDSF3-8]|uniref:carbonate dehydratase n=1 Tax=Roseivirga sp. BDSF3-8 TaxID=3241598 RepID=UPI003531884D
MKPFERLLLENKAWAQEKLEEDKEFFSRHATTQKPKFLWIGCSDSRVPANEVTHTQPGEIFVHRNIANMVVHTDLNLLSVLQYAVEVLEVEHVIVCGHYGCGGVKAAMSRNNFGLINKWLRNIKDVYRMHREEISAITDENDRVNKLVELNTIEQVHNLAKTTFIQDAWKGRKAPTLHGWVYNLEDGLLNELVQLDHDHKLDDIYMYD